MNAGRQAPVSALTELKPWLRPFRRLATGEEGESYVWREWWAMALVSSAFLIVLLLTHATGRVDNAIYDLSLKLDGHTPRSDIVIVAIDQQSLTQVRQWPWPRKLQAQLIDAIGKDHPKAVAPYLYFVFSSTPVDDQAIHDAMVRTPTYIPIPRKESADKDRQDQLKPIRKIASAVRGMGLGEQIADSDGIVRRASLIEGQGPQSTPRLVLQIARAEMSGRAISDRMAHEKILIPYVGKSRTFPTISAGDVLDGQVFPGTFRNKYVLIGPTAADFLDDYVTPTSARMSDVEIDANLLNSILEHRTIWDTPRPVLIVVSLFLLWVSLLALIRLSPRENLLFAIAIIVLPLAASVIGLIALDAWVPPTSFLFTVGVVTFYWGWRRLHAASNYFAQELRGLQQHTQANLYGGLQPPMKRGDLVFQQMTLLQEAKKRISDLRRFVSDILANFPEPIFVVNLDGHIQTANEAANILAHRLGVSAAADALVDAVLSRIAPLKGATADGWPPIAELASRSGTDTLDHSLTGRGPDGRAFELRFTPTLSGEDEQIGWIVHLADITVLMLALDQREVAMRQREEALQLLSHDMRSPQASILATLQHPEFQAAPQKLLQLVDSQARRTLDLADAFVRLAQAESAEYTLEVLDFSYIAEEAIDAVWSLAQQAGVVLDLQIGGEYIVLADRGALIRALVNLLDNAVKFSAAGASVKCVVRAAALDRREAVACEIIDSAGGMPQALASRIFSRFATSGHSTNGSSGIGLGLSLVQAVATRHQGSIVCRSAPGVGSVFTLTLPLHRESEEAEALRATA